MTPSADRPIRSGTSAGPAASRARRGELPIRLEAPVDRALRWRGLRRRERIDVEALLAAVADADPEAALPLPPGFALVERRSASAWIVDTADGRARLERLSPGRGRSRAAHAHRVTHRLRARGFAVPRVLGFVERAVHPARAPSWLVTEWIPGPTLAALAESGVLGDPGERRRLGREVAALLGRLHRAGWVHGGMTPSHVVVTDDAVYLVGLDRARRARSDATRAEDLRALLIPDLRTTEALRYLLDYLGRHPGAPETARRWIRRLGAHPVSGDGWRWPV